MRVARVGLGFDAEFLPIHEAHPNTTVAVIQDAHKMHMVLTDEGRIYSGIPAGKTDREVLLRVAGKEEPVVVPKANIESREIASVSMMPLGLLKEFSDSEIVDLFAFLMRSEQRLKLP